MKIASDIPGKLDLLFSLDGGNIPCKLEINENNDFLLSGKACETIHSDGKTGIFFHARLRIIGKNGNVMAEKGKLHIAGSDEVLVLVAAATGFDGRDPVKYCEDKIEQASAFSYGELLDAHIKDHQAIFNRVVLNLDEETGNDVPTDLMLQQVKNGTENNFLTALMFQYGRYLLMASSRGNSPLPAHLQGVWDDYVACRIGWTCDMHLDINTQMNYWPAEVANLSECHEPLFHWIENKLLPSGRITAKSSYGLNGWVAELVSNAWGFTAPYWHSNLSPCPTGGVWVTTHMWEHYLFTKDTEFLKTRAFPVIKEAVEFFIDYVFEDKETEYITCGPSISPENAFLVDGQAYTASIGATYEIVMIREIFNIFIKASEELGYTNDLVDKVKSTAARLLPFQVGATGELKEWAHDFKAADAQHRHTSHLLSVYPFCQITPEKSPELAEAARICIKQRMTPGENWEDTGWARSMLMLYSARLWEHDALYGHISAMLQHLTNDNLMVKHPSTRGAPSFADVYELDGNTGLTACIAEALLQSHNGEIHLLPVLPPLWKNGYVKGLRARGGYEVEMEWKGGRLTAAVIGSKYASRCTVRYGNIRKTFETEAGSTYRFDGSLA